MIVAQAVRSRFVKPFRRDTREDLAPVEALRERVEQRTKGLGGAVRAVHGLSAA